MAKKMKKPLSSPPKKKPVEDQNEATERPWWARPDDELVKDRAKKIKEWYGSKKIDLDDDDRQQLIEEAVRRDPRIENLLDKVIVKKEGITKKDEFLLVPVYSSERGKKIASVLKLKTFRRIRLDEYGWGVWNLIDGKRDVRRIGKVLMGRFGPEVDPLYPRLAKFLAYLQNLELITIEDD